MPIILHSLLPTVRVCMPMSCFLRCYSGKSEYAHDTCCCSLHLHEQYGRDITLHAPVESRMPMYDYQVKLSRVGAIKSSLLLILWKCNYHTILLTFQERASFILQLPTMIYCALTCFILTFYALIIEFCQAFVSNPTLGVVGIKLIANEQDVVVVQHDPPFVQEWTLTMQSRSSNAAEFTEYVGILLVWEFLLFGELDSIFKMFILWRSDCHCLVLFCGICK